MFFQPPAEEETPTCSSTLKTNSRSRRQKKLRRKNKLKALKKKQIASKQRARSTAVPSVSVPIASMPITMSSWAENFTRAATWQLKHEVAFWKSKALALEHENKILHRVIRENTVGSNKSTKEVSFECSSTESESEEEVEESRPESQASDPEFVVSEEYIQFLRDNQVYRDWARQEREKLKAKYDAENQEIEELEAGPAENPENHQEMLQKLYGDAWERIAALETSLQTQFISICDRDKPGYWPSVPFNFNSIRTQPASSVVIV